MKNWIMLLMTFWGLFGKSQSAAVPLRVAEIFGNHMVLQQQTDLKIWGWATPGSTVEVRVSWGENEVFSTAAAANQRWELEIRTPMASLDTHQIQISNNKKTITLRDVLVGEVWLCSGQSNMEWTVREAGYSNNSVEAAEFSHIRHLKVEHSLSLTPLDHLETKGWQVCSPANVSDFSAVAYFFAVEIAKKYGIPVGLVNASWGGSQIEGWWSMEGMANSPVFQKYANDFPKDWEAADQFLMKKMLKHVFGSAQHPLPTNAEENAYHNFDFDISSWCIISPEHAWDWQHFWAFRGDGFMALDVEIPDSESGQAAQLVLGSADLSTEIWLNGKILQKSADHHSGKISVKVPKKWLRAGRNRLFLHQKLQNRKTWCEMGLRGNTSDFYLQFKNKKIDLSNGWRAMPSFAQPNYFIRGANNLPTILYNGMVHPLVGFELAGVLWYQGESNAGRAHEYRHSFPLLVTDWRARWQRELPFLFVQLPNYRAGGGTANSGSEWAELREAQTFALQLPKTGMAVCLDLGESNDIHPKNKKPVGQRLAREAFRVVFGENVASCAGTRPLFTFQNDGSVEINFPHETRKLTLRDPFATPHFEVAGSDQVFFPAETTIVAPQILSVKSAKVQQPVAVRYAWADDPAVHLFWEDGCPLAPFRSDDWAGKTFGEQF